MLNRCIGIGCLLCMLSVNSALFVREILPNWTAGDPPATAEPDLRAGEARRVQVAIYNEQGVRIGHTWTKSRYSGSLLIVESNTVLISPLPGQAANPRVHIHTTLTYHPDTGRLDKLTHRMYGLGVVLEVSGEYFPPDEFPCDWSFGDQHGAFILDARATRALGDLIRPFDRLPGLFVGRVWRIELFDLLAKFLPGAESANVSLTTAIVRVTGTERIQHGGQTVQAFVVEAPPAKAWVAPDGRVLRQVVHLPLLGRLTLVHEPFDEQAFQRIVRRQGRK